MEELYNQINKYLNTCNKVYASSKAQLLVTAWAPLNSCFFAVRCFEATSSARLRLRSAALPDAPSVLGASCKHNEVVHQVRQVQCSDCYEKFGQPVGMLEKVHGSTQTISQMCA